MAIGTPTSIGSATASTGAMTLAMTATAAVAAGQFIVVVASCSGSGNSCTFSDSAGNTWATDVSANALANGQCFIGSCQVTNALTSGVSTITMALGTSQSARLICAVQVSGIATTAAKDQTKTASGSVVGWSTGASAATTQADEIVIAACGNDSNSTETSTPGVGFTELFDFANATAAELTVAYKVVSATGAQTGSGTWTNSGARGWNAALVTYKAASGGASPVTVTPSASNVVFSSTASAQAATAVTPAPASTVFSATAAATAQAAVSPAGAAVVFASSASVTTSATVDLGTVTATAAFAAAATTTATSAVAPSPANAAFSAAGSATASSVVAGSAATTFAATAAAVAPPVVVPAAASSVFGAGAVVTTPGTPAATSRLPLVGVGT